jgi:aspartate/methionine/tyrosine aminotransferase
VRLAPFELERFFARHEFTVAVNACASDVEAPSMAEVLSWASEDTRAAWDGLRLGYTEAPGHPRLRAAIAALYEGLEAEDVLVFAGAEEAIFAWASVVLEAGDHAIVVWPSYQSLHEVARAAGADITLLELRHEDGWRLDPATIPPDADALVLNSPHNPTGAGFDYDTFPALVEGFGGRVFSDEVYRWGEHAGTRRLPAACEVSPTAVSLGVMSKTFALPGLRIGWLACRDRDLLERLAAFKDYTTICCSAPSELLAIAALESLDAVLERTRSIVEPNLAACDAFFERHAGRLEWVRPAGAPIGFPRLVDGSVEALAERLLREQDTLILPGRVYGHPGEHFRLGFGRRDLPEALARLERVL